MTNKELNDIILEMKGWESEMNRISEIVESLKSQLKSECIRRNEDEINTDVFIVRYKDVTSRRFDTESFKKEHAKLYSKYIKENVSKRFTCN